MFRTLTTRPALFGALLGTAMAFAPAALPAQTAAAPAATAPAAAPAPAANPAPAPAATPAAPAATPAPGASAAAPARTVTAELKDTAGAALGSATISDTASGAMLVTVDLHGLPPGKHALHIHEVGKCEPPKFESAKGHLTGGKEHGINAHGGMHTGDLPNVTVPADGTLKADFFIPAATLDVVMDADGSSLIMHAKPDVYVSQPSGNAGDRIACGVFTE